MIDVQARVNSSMAEDSDEDDMPLVFERSNTASKQTHSNAEVKRPSSQNHDSKSGGQHSDIRSSNGQNTSSQKGTISSSKSPPVRSPLASPQASSSSVGRSPLASPKASSSSAKPGMGKPPVSNSKASASVEMGKGKDNDSKCSNQFRWTESMDLLLLEILTEEAQLGNKPSNTFKHSSFARVAKAVTEKFECQCEPKHVENHLRTIKVIWSAITKIRDKSGFGWDDNLKMVTCSNDTYIEEITAHPNHAKSLNKKIQMFDEMTMVEGKDMATGSFAKSFNDIDLETSIGSSSAQDLEDNDFEEVTKRKEASSIGASSKPRSHRKRSREDGDSSYELLARQIGEVANAIKSLCDDRVKFTEDLYREVMKTEGFDEEFLGCVFDHLIANSNLGRGFMVKSDNLRRKWIEKFMTKE